MEIATVPGITDSPENSAVERHMLAQQVPEYQVVREIGRGSMGVVFLARDVMLHRLVAIKVLRHELAAVEEHRERFRREARMTARLNDEGIVAVHSFGERGDLVYIIMEYVRGTALGTRLALLGGAGMRHKDVRAILVSLARTLEHAHEQGIVHRDLKPENVLIEHGTGRARLTDFGVALSRSMDPSPTEVARAFGTPHFMSPEQAVGDSSLDGRSDIYSLGVLGYLMLTGTLPFDAGSFGAVITKHVTEAPVPVRERADGIPVDLAQAVEKCLEKDPSQRWRRAGELAAVLYAGRNHLNIGDLVSRMGRVAAVIGAAWGMSATN